MAGAVDEKEKVGKVKVTAKNPVKRRSASAAALFRPFLYRKRVVKSAKTYRRKGKTPFAQEDD